MGSKEPFSSTLKKGRFRSTILFCLVVMGCLFAWVLTPRTWTSAALLHVTSAEDEAASSRMISRFRSALPAGSADAIEVDAAPGQLRIRLRSPSADRAIEQLALILARVLRDEAAERREAMGRERAELEGDVLVSGAAVEAATRELQSVRQMSLSGTSAVLPERIAELESQLQALSAEMQKLEASNADLLHRRTDIDRRVQELQPEIQRADDHKRMIAAQRDELAALRSQSTTRVARIEELENRLSQAAVELAALEMSRKNAQAKIRSDLQPALDDIDSRSRELRSRIDALSADIAVKQAGLDDARHMLSTLLERNPELAERQRTLTELSAKDARLHARLQDVRDEMAVGGRDGALPFEIRERPSLPLRPDGVPSAGVVAVAIVAGLLCVVPKIVFDALMFRGDRQIEAEPALTPTAVRWDAVTAAILLAVTVASCAFFVAVES